MKTEIDFNKYEKLSNTKIIKDGDLYYNSESKYFSVVSGWTNRKVSVRYMKLNYSYIKDIYRNRKKEKVIKKII